MGYNSLQCFLVIIYAHLNAVIKSTKWVIIQSTMVSLAREEAAGARAAGGSSDKRRRPRAGRERRRVQINDKRRWSFIAVGREWRGRGAWL